MTFELVTIPCLSDNYAYLIHDAGTGQTGCIDVPDAAAILAAVCDHRGPDQAQDDVTVLVLRRTA